MTYAAAEGDPHKFLKLGEVKVVKFGLYVLFTPIMFLFPLLFSVLIPR